MDTMRAIVQGQLSEGQPLKVFDWNEAARRIKDSGATKATAGLGSDWEYTGGTIFRDGEPVYSDDDEGYTYLASIWAYPELNTDGDFGSGEDCWLWQYETDGWDAHTKWPQSALDILNSISGEVVEIQEIEA